MLALHILRFVAHVVTHPLWQGAGPAISVDLPQLLTSFLALAGFAALTAAVINAGKFIGLIADGQAPNVSIALNVAGFAALVILRLFKPDFDVAGADSVLATVASILTGILALGAQLGFTKIINNGLKGLPVIGYSHSRKIEQARAAEAKFTTSSDRSR